MFQLLEIVGVSREGYSEAIQSAVNKLQDAGEKVYWFELLEQRGGIRNGEVEFQAKLKVAVSVEAEEDKGLFLCPSCGRASDRAENLCNPKRV
jgi:flavin-binding protein dodecin